MQIRHRSSSNIREILNSAAQLRDPIRVQGANLSAQAFFVAQYVQNRKQTQQPLVVLCPDQDIAADFAADLECLHTTLVPNSEEIHVFPTWEQSPYSPIAPSIRTRLSRLTTLHALTSKSPPAVVITTIAAAYQATLPRALFLQHSITLQVNASIGSREALVSRLIETGYARVDTVEDPGTFAVRGEIVDIFASNHTQPLRVELFGDVIERIRNFDPGTQRTSNRAEEGIQSTTIAPAREVLINSQTSTLLRERLKEKADDEGIHRNARDPILASVQNSNYPDHSDAWAPFAYPNSETLWNYLATDQPPEVLWIDELSVMQNWDSFLQEQNRLAQEVGKSSLILPSVDELFRWNASLEKEVRGMSRIFLDRVQLASLDTLDTLDTLDAADASEAAPSDEEKISTHHQVFVRANTDLTTGSSHPVQELEPKLRLWLKQGFKVIALASTQSQVQRIAFLLGERELTCLTETAPQASLITAMIGTFSEGFRWPAEGVVILTEPEILGTRVTRKNRAGQSRRGGGKKGEESAAKSWAGLQALSDLSIEDAVVHVDHGIGRYQGLVRLDLQGAPSDFLLLEYANKDRLYLPVYRLNVIQKYIGASESVVLDKLGAQQFNKTKDKVKEAVKKLAVDLIQLYAERKIRPGIRLSPPDGLFREFEAKFPFDETPDQLKAIDDILRDLESGRSMDRLVCGDVGYGKTEVAIRAAFSAVSDGKQVAVLVPTTVLAFQHEQSFKARMKEYPINIDSISRFKSAKEQKAVLEGLSSGKVDVVIGTHRLLSRDVRFRDLGLVIVDEEHRFGVEHKERLKALKINTHVLTLTATPIPRTLHMALSGLRDISLINTAPVDRLPIRTYISKFDENLIQRAIQFELTRGGQVFFLHNRVQTIHEIAKTIQHLVPSASIGIAHGQMTEGALEKTMLSFYEKKTNVLVCTTIIESGLDVPSANTILINRADSLGLAQLYQIRGRVGRGQNRAYAYLLIPAEGAVTNDAKRRLEVIQKFVELGSGFSIASHDLEIRGGGDILGAQQSGNINAVGFDLYLELLDEAIRDLENKPRTPEETAKEPEIKAPFPAFLSEEFVPDIHQRLSLYRRFSATTHEEQITALEEELLDRFGTLPPEAQNLIWLIRLKQLLKHHGIDALTVGPERISILPGTSSTLNPARAIALVSSNPAQYQLLPDSKFVAKLGSPSIRELFFGVEKLLKSLSVT